jgi:dihydroorotate dehydrogenase
MPLYDLLVGPALRLLDAETAHDIAIGALKRGLVPAAPSFEDEVLRVALWGLEFPNPIGVAAGFDKNAEAVDARLGLGFMEVGSVTPRPQPGNPKPRLFRLPADDAVINRLGFNNDGHAVVAGRIKRRRRRIILGVNLGQNKNSADAEEDYRLGVEAFAGLADYLVINVSSPNTPGLRELQGRERLGGLLETVLAARAAGRRRPPLLLKIAPDLNEADMADIARAALDAGVDGLIATNTTVARPDTLTDPNRFQAGGLSGRPLFEPSTRVLSEMYRLTEGRLALIGVGGVASGADAYAKIRAGASLVQLYTALIYHGPELVERIKRGLAERLRVDGFASVAEAVGADHR